MAAKRIAASYVLLVIVPFCVLLGILRLGSRIKAPPIRIETPVSATGQIPSQGATTGPGPLGVMTLVLEIAVVLFATRVFGFLFRLIGQPQVVGEMAAGIALGPSLLGWTAPTLFARLFPASTLDYLNALSQIGLVLFMFLVGLALNPTELKRFGHSAVLISHVSIIAPFVLGSGLALYLYPRLSNDSVTFTGFAMFMGAAMSITAFPVLARILSERNMLTSRLGTIVVACAAVDDATGWCVLAGIVALIRAHESETPLWLTAGGAAVFAGVMIFGVRRLLRKFEAMYRRESKLTDGSMAVIVLLVLVSALVTEWLGIHLLFGAFLLGAIMPKQPSFVRYILEKFESVTLIVLVPLFFAYSGLRTSVGAISAREISLYFPMILAVAVVGKLGGSMTAARRAGMHWRDSAAIGVLMNTRGLMELVILNIGLDIKVISPALFSLMVLMALVTTLMTTPLLAWVYPASRELDGAEEIQQILQ